MLRLRIEVVDANRSALDPFKVQTIATAEITNLGTNDQGLGNDNPLGDYLGEFTLHGKKWGRDYLFNFERRKLTVWHLLYMLLRIILEADASLRSGREGHDGHHAGDR